MLLTMDTFSYFPVDFNKSYPSTVNTTPLDNSLPSKSLQVCNSKNKWRPKLVPKMDGNFLLKFSAILVAAICI